MKLPRLLCLALAAASVATLRAAEPSTPAPAAPAAPEFEMTTYYLCLLTRGPAAGTGTQEERLKIQAGHMANIRRLADSGKLLVAGPFADNGEWRGIFIFKCASLEEAQALVATDPAIQAGRLKAEIHPWMTAKGYIRDPEFPTPGPIAPK